MIPQSECKVNAMVKKESYQCPRCGYTTSQKGHMRHHLYKNKKECPSTSDNIGLTDEIKEHVLTNRVYKVVTKTITNTTITNNINNFHVINSLISNMDPLEKLQRYVDYKNLEIIDIEDDLEERFMLKSKKLDNNKVKHLC